MRALPRRCAAVQDDFRHVLEHATSSVAPEELEQFVKWTAEFGEEGV